MYLDKIKAYIKDKTPKETPISDGGVIVDRVWVNKKEIKAWLEEKENEGYVLTAQSLSALFYLF